MDDKWLWEHMPDFQMGLCDRLWKAFYNHKILAADDISSNKKAEIEDEAKFIAGELVNLVAYSMGKEIAASSGNKAILRELEQYKNSVTDNSRMVAHLTETQIERAEKYGIIYYLVMKNTSLDQIADKTELPTETVNTALNDDLWLLGL